MSCDDNHEARAKDRVRRSLPIVGSGSGRSGRPGAVRGGQSGRPRGRSGAPSRSGRARSTPGAANEFPGGAAELDGVSRRGFMQLLGVSTAVATVGAACRKPNEKIIPFVRRPEELTPGNALHFATGYALEGYTSGLLVESHEGHPTKIEGNPVAPRDAGRDHHRRAGADPGPLRRRSRQAAAPRRHPDRLADVPGRDQGARRRRWRRTAAPGCAS